MTELEKRGFRVTRSAEDAPAAVVQGFAPEVGWRELAEASFALNAHGGPTPRAGHPVDRDEHGLDDPAWRAASRPATARSSRRCTPRSAGSRSSPASPRRPIFEEARRRFGAERPLVVGDRLDTDILGANRAGMASAVVLTGIDRAKQVLAADAASRPDFILGDLRGAARAVPGRRGCARWCGARRRDASRAHRRPPGRDRRTAATTASTCCAPPARRSGSRAPRSTRWTCRRASTPDSGSRAAAARGSVGRDEHDDDPRARRTSTRRREPLPTVTDAASRRGDRDRRRSRRAPRHRVAAARRAAPRLPGARRPAPCRARAVRPVARVELTMPEQRLDAALAARGLARSRTHAATLIAAGVVTVDGARAWSRPSLKVAESAVLEVAASDHYVSRAAHKLIAALDGVRRRPRRPCRARRRRLDRRLQPGAARARRAHACSPSTSGTASSRPSSRDAPGLVLVEGCNVRHLDAASLAELTGVDERPSLVVGRPLVHLARRWCCRRCARPRRDDADFVLLVKPQFEVGRGGVREGVVRDAGAPRRGGRERALGGVRPGPRHGRRPVLPNRRQPRKPRVPRPSQRARAA